MLAVAPTVDDLGHPQREVLIPLELQLIERGATERLTPDQVLSAARRTAHLVTFASVAPAPPVAAST